MLQVALAVKEKIEKTSEKMSKPKQALSRSSSIGDDVGYLKSEIEKLKAENERLSRQLSKMGYDHVAKRIYIIAKTTVSTKSAKSNNANV